MRYQKLIKTVGTIFIIGFALNLAWEVIQTLIFFDFPPGHLKLFVLIHLQATSADAGYTLLIYFFVMILTWSLNWLSQLTIFRIAATMLAGFMIAVAIERQALTTGHWSYGRLMPIIPYLKVGLMPVLQLTLLPLTTYLITKRLVSPEHKAKG